MIGDSHEKAAPAVLNLLARLIRFGIIGASAGMGLLVGANRSIEIVADLLLAVLVGGDLVALDLDERRVHRLLVLVGLT
jgi:hypothetical protein